LAVAAYLMGDNAFVRAREDVERVVNSDTWGIEKKNSVVSELTRESFFTEAID
jgi:hypothetical protein